MGDKITRIRNLLNALTVTGTRNCTLVAAIDETLKEMEREAAKGGNTQTNAKGDG